MTEQVGWAPTRSGAVFTGLHLPVEDARATAVVLVPPFGWEGVSAGRNLRAWNMLVYTIALGKTSVVEGSCHDSA